MELRLKKYIIPLKPIAWKRAGISGVRFYDQQIDEKIAYGLYILRDHGSDPIFEKPVHLDIVFYMSMGQTKKSLTKNKPNAYHKATPDLSNLIKLLEDAIVDAKVLTDDRLISIITAKKIYGSNPRTEFNIRELQ